MANKNPHVKEVMDRLLDRVMVADPVDDIKQRLRKFVSERNWQATERIRMGEGEGTIGRNPI